MSDIPINPVSSAAHVKSQEGELRAQQQPIVIRNSGEIVSNTK